MNIQVTSSLFEERVAQALQTLKIEAKEEYEIRSIPGRYFDFQFRCGNQRIILEADGAQHFTVCPYVVQRDNIRRLIERQEIDRMKTQAALDAGYKVIRIDNSWSNKTIRDIAEFIVKAVNHRFMFMVTDNDKYRWLFNILVLPAPRAVISRSTNCGTRRRGRSTRTRARRHSHI
jgi:very-short-patch-repair endonuclease